MARSPVFSHTLRTTVRYRQAQAKSALLFLYGQLLTVELPWLDEVVSAKTERRLPVVLTPTEVRRLLECVFRRTVTDRFGIVTAEFGIVTARFGDVTDGRLVPA